jgi:serine/threonine protein kinase
MSAHAMVDEPSKGPYVPESRLHEAIASFEQARDAGQDPNPQEWLGRYPEVAAQLADFFADELGVHQLLGPLRQEASGRSAQMDTDFHVGEKIENRWEVENIFHGGMGIVYVVMDHQMEEQLVMKTYRDDCFAANSMLASRFEKEALAWIGLGVHPNVVQAKYFRTFRNKPFLFLEYMPGGNLLGRLPVTSLYQVERWAIDFCDGMIHAAKSGITAHRDIKPENCLLCRRFTLRPNETSEIAEHPERGDLYDCLKISDFGLAKVFDDLVVAPDLPFVLRATDCEQPRSKLEEQGTVDHIQQLRSMSMLATRTGVALGTPCYMAPEQFDDAKNVDVKADIYSFGVMLFQMIAGRLPFSCRNLLEYQHFHQRVAPPKLSMNEPACREWLAQYDEPDREAYMRAGVDLAKDGMPQAFSEIVDRCLAKDPAQRFEDFEKVRLALVDAEPYDPYQTYLPDSPPHPLGRQRTEDELLSEALSYLELGRQNLALAVFDRLIERYPRNRRANFEKGKLLLTMPYRYEEARALIQQAESIGDLQYTELDVDAALPKILDSIVDRLFQEFKQIERAFVIICENVPERLVPKLIRVRRPQDETNARIRHNLVRRCLETDQGFLTYDSRGEESTQLGHRLPVVCLPLRDASGRRFGVIQLDIGLSEFTGEDFGDLVRVLDAEVHSIPPWVLPLIPAWIRSHNS